MSDGSRIEWTDATWNPTTGCTKVSPGCDNCYAETFAERFRGVPGHHFENGFDVLLRHGLTYKPLEWKRPRRIFVNSMSDLFHDDISDDYIAEVFAVMARAPQHTFQLLTKRHGRMRSLINGDLYDLMARHLADEDGQLLQKARWPLSNLWLGVSVEDQKRANLRIPALLGTHAAVRWASVEPQLGPVDLRDCGGVDALEPDWVGGARAGSGTPHPLLDWVVAGGESGRGARPMCPAWARLLRDQCLAAEVPFLFKQWGEWAPLSPLLARPGDSVVHSETGEVHDIPAAGLDALPIPLRRRSYAVRRVGKQVAGRHLDGELWDLYPAPEAA